MALGAPPQNTGSYTGYTTLTRWIVLIAVMLGTVLEVLDTSIVNVAIPDMMGNLGATLDQIGWVSTGYIIANVIILPLTGWLSGHFGRRRYLAGSMILFTAASLCCGMSHTLNQLVFFRIVQGAGGAALLSTAQATMMEIFPPAQLGLVQAVYGIGVMVGPTVGPTLGGWITDNYTWPWIFFINVPIGIMATTLTLLFMRDSQYQKKTNTRIDIIGIGFLAIGLGCLQTVLEKGNRENWFDSRLICWLVAYATVCLLAFIIWEMRTEHPAVNLRILKNRTYAAGVLMQVAIGVGLYGGVFLLPIYLQDVRGYTAAQTGWILLPGGLATGFMMPLLSRIVLRVPARILVFIGSCLFIASMWMLHTVTMDTGPEHLFLPLIVRGIAFSCLFLPLAIATLSLLKGKEIAEGTGLFNLARQLGGSAGIAALSTYLAQQSSLHRAALVEKVTAYNPLAQARLSGYQHFFLSKGASLAIAHKQAFAAMDGVITGQSFLLAFQDAFLMIGLIFAAMMPLILLLRKTSVIPAGGKMDVH